MLKALFLTLRLEDEEFSFLVDTGTPVTLIDRSLESRLGKRSQEKTIHSFWGNRTIGGYKAPKLYLGNAQLLTGGLVWTDDLSGFGSRNRECRTLGVLGMDCMRHYAIQIDTGARKVRFLDSNHLQKAGLGKALPLLTGRFGCPEVRESLTGSTRGRLLLDTGCEIDGILEPKEFQLLAQLQKGIVWTNQFRSRLGSSRQSAIFPTLMFDGQTYTNVVIDESPAMLDKDRTCFNAIGMPFLARHIVTFDFPNKTLYLKRRDPLPTRRTSTREL